MVLASAVGTVTVQRADGGESWSAALSALPPSPGSQAADNTPLTVIVCSSCNNQLPV